mmetsp:Transcript_39373/g.101888  ORF Transcript_39373/g.101888 Transcript_39373/m.101888 type:complete len:298 (-) Transcript_39373:55-948(-)
MGFSAQQYVPVQNLSLPLQPPMVPATHVQNCGTQHWEPLQETKSLPQSLPQELCMPAMHCLGSCAQHMVPVQDSPWLSQPPMVPAPQVHSLGTQHCEPVHVMPSPLQEPSMPATHCIGSSRQQYVPVQRCPFCAQTSAQPATHWEPLGTQHKVPVQCMPLALQLLSKPGTQVAGLLTQHLSPVQKLPPASHALWCPPEHVQSSGTLQTLFLPSHETPLTVSPQVPQKFQEPGTSCEPALDVLFRAWLCRSILVASIETQSPPSAEQASSLAEPKRPIATAATPNTSEIFTMAAKQED